MPVTVKIIPILFIVFLFFIVGVPHVQHMGENKLCATTSNADYDSLAFFTFDDCKSECRKRGKYFAFGNRDVPGSAAGTFKWCRTDGLTCKCWCYKLPTCTVGSITGSNLFMMEGMSFVGPMK